MVAHAERVGTVRPVTWRQADVMALPYANESFDVVVCQFGAMFFPDRVAAYREIRRVLRPGGTFLFNLWSGIEDNEFADVVTQALSTHYPDDPPLFLARTPHGHGRPGEIESDVKAAGFDRCSVSRRDDISFAAGPTCRRSPTATALRCATRSRRAIRAASSGPRQSPPQRSAHATVTGRSRDASVPWWPPPAEPMGSWTPWKAHLRFVDFLPPEALRATAARMSALNAFASISSPS